MRPLLLLHKAHAFVTKDWIIDSSYKAAFTLEILQTLVPLLSFYFVSKLVPVDSAGSLSRYGGRYFPFVLVGLALSQYLNHALASFATSIRRAQMAGCLEAMLGSRTSPAVIILLSPLYSFLFKTVHVFLSFVIGGLALGVNFSECNYPAAATTLLLSVLAFSSLGVLSAASIVVLKKGDPIEWLLTAALALVSGAYFPVEVLPSWLQALSAWSPLTHALTAMRAAIFRGATVASLAAPLGVLALTTAVLFPLGVWGFSRAVERGRRDGTLSDY